MREPCSSLEDVPVTLRAGARSEPFRRSCHREVSCRAVGDKITSRGQGVLRNVSLQGVCLHLNRRFDVGRLLAIELLGAAGRGERRLLAYLIRVAPTAGGQWELGCLFTSRLTEEELWGLLA
jgi:hypothetical protein